LLFAIALILHFIIWRICLPKRQTKALTLIFFGVLFFGALLCFKCTAAIRIFAYHPPGSISEFFQLCLFFSVLTVAYLITYSAVEADSPSLVIAMKIYAAGPTGLSKDTLERELNNAVLITPRIRDLVMDKMVESVGGRYRLKTKGIWMARLFGFYRKLMGAGMGG
jgi:hypothetical protein